MQISIRMGNKHVEAELPQKMAEKIYSECASKIFMAHHMAKKAQSIRGRLWQQAPENRMSVKAIKDSFFCAAPSAGK